MSTLAWLAILAGGLLIRQVATGRVKHTGDDLKSIFTAVLNADPEAIAETTGQRGENIPIGDATPSPDGSTGGTPGKPPAGSSALASAAVRLGASARGYKLGATGPDYYDCSGLIWRASQKIGVYGGSRYTTATFSRAAEGWAVRVSEPKPGDIVLWAGKHIGVLVGEDRMYSARSPSKGIGYSTVSGDSGYFGTSPTYWRVT